MVNEARNRRVRQDQQSPSRPTATRDPTETRRKADELLRRSCHVQRFATHRIPPPEGTSYRRDLGQGKTGPILLLPSEGRCLIRLRYRAAATPRLGSHHGRSENKVGVHRRSSIHLYVYDTHIRTCLNIQNLTSHYT